MVPFWMATILERKTQQAGSSLGCLEADAAGGIPVSEGAWIWQFGRKEAGVSDDLKEEIAELQRQIEMLAKESNKALNDLGIASHMIDVQREESIALSSERDLLKRQVADKERQVEVLISGMCDALLGRRSCRRCACKTGTDEECKSGLREWSLEQAKATAKEGG